MPSLAEGIDPQDRVAFLDKNGPEYFDVLIGGAKVNAVDVAVNWRLAAPEVAYIVNDAQAKVLIVGEEFVPVLDAIEGDLTTVKKIVIVGSHPRHESFEDWTRSSRRDRSRACRPVPTTSRCSSTHRAPPASPRA